jgi:hypothetical protein
LTEQGTAGGVDGGLIVPPAIRPRRSVEALGGWGRAWAACIAAGLLGVLGVAAWLTPAAAGHGTHAQLGMAPCPWAANFNVPCPTCGMTTAFAQAANGDLLASVRSQPMGALLSLAMAAGFWAAVHVAVTGSHLGSVCARLLRPGVIWAVAGAVAAAWAYKYATWT